jgi:PPOX class probable F420-dependent enzyme
LEATGYHPDVTDTALSDARTDAPGQQFISIPNDVRSFLEDTHFATIATVDPDGAPRQAVIWYTLEGDGIVMNSAVGRRWPSNLLRDPRISFSVTDERDGYRWIGLSGLVTPIEDQAVAQADIAGMARRYHADDPAKAERLITRKFERQARISFRLRPTHLFVHFD